MTPRQPVPGEDQHFARLTGPCPSCRNKFCECSANRYRHRIGTALCILALALAILVVIAAVDLGVDALTAAFCQIGFDNFHNQRTSA